MNWLAFQSSFLLTFEILGCKYLVPWPSPVQVQMYLWFSPFLLILNQKKQQKLEDKCLVWALSVEQGLVKRFLENSPWQFLVILGIAGVWNSAFCDSVVWLFMCPVCSTSVRVHLILSIVLVLLYTLGLSVPFSCMIQYEFGVHWLTTVAGSQDVFCILENCHQSRFPWLMNVTISAQWVRPMS